MILFDKSVNIGIGTDIESISRFKRYTIGDSDKILKTIFTDGELEYCFSKDYPAPHLAARFVGKEAVIKALHGIDVKDVFYKDIEILNSSSGVPYVLLNNINDNIVFKISLSHSKENAIAFVMAMEITENEWRRYNKEDI